MTRSLITAGLVTLLIAAASANDLIPRQILHGNLTQSVEEACGNREFLLCTRLDSESCQTIGESAIVTCLDNLPEVVNLQDTPVSTLTRCPLLSIAAHHNPAGTGDHCATLY